MYVLSRVYVHARSSLKRGETPEKWWDSTQECAPDTRTCEMGRLQGAAIRDCKGMHTRPGVCPFSKNPEEVGNNSHPRGRSGVGNNSLPARVEQGTGTLRVCVVCGGGGGLNLFNV